MSPSNGSKPARLLLIGSLPPPPGGGTISFEYFYRFVVEREDLSVTHVDLHARRVDAHGRYAGRSSIRTAVRAAATLGRIPGADVVALFASRRMAFSYGLLLILAARLFRKPVHLRLFGGRPYQLVASRPAPMRRLTDHILSLASGITLETNAGRNDFPPAVRGLVKAVPGYRPACPPTTFQKPEDDRIRFVYAGRVDRSKGIDTLVEACRIVRSGVPASAFEVDCFGPASPDFVDRYGAEPSIRFKGTVDNAAYLAELPSYDAFVYPSIYDNEGHPGAVIEAMRCGLPVVCTALPTTMEIVRDGTEGLLFEPGNEEALAECMSRLITDSALRKSLAAASRTKGAEFDVGVVVPRLLREMGL